MKTFKVVSQLVRTRIV
ncbi:hypothetical protein KEJ25_05210, partial [Candidatus Bathyarchaeota archaeon]|nr:hypothetical protein [Candidatus Bathyarchaeota archaeon]